MKMMSDYTKFDFSNNTKYTLIDTFNRNCEDYFQDFKEWAEDINGYEIEGEEENMVAYFRGGKVTFWNWYYDTLNMEDSDFWEGFRIAIKNEPLYTRCVITGDLGLWTGRHSIYPTLCEDLYSAVMKCLTDAQDCILTIENNVLNVECLHHDGRNYFQIRLVSADNYDKLNYWNDDEDGDMEDYFKDEKNFMEFYWDFFGLA